MRVVSTVKFGWTATDMANRQLASWASAHPLLWVSLRIFWWVARRPLHVAGFVLSVWLVGLGLWWPLATAAGGILPVSWRLRSLRGVLSFPSRGKTPKPSPGIKTKLLEVLRAFRRWRILRDAWPTAAGNAGIADRVDKTRIPKLRNVQSTTTGISADISCGNVGVTADKVSKSAETLAASIRGCRAVTVAQGRTPGTAMLHFMWGDPLARTVGLERLPVPPAGRLSFGIVESGEPATIAKFKSLLVVGQSGSGKSGTLWALLASALADGVPFKLRVVDPAGGVELHDLKTSPLTREYTDRPSTTEDLISHAHAAMNKRLEAMSGSTRMHKPTAAEPWEIIVIDELLLLTDTLSKNAYQQLRDIMSVGRKACFSVWALTQVPEIDTVGKIRRFFVQKLVLATESRAMTDSVLGDGAESSGAMCSRIRESTPGLGFARIEGISGYPRFRTAWVPDDAMRQIAAGRLPDYVPTREGKADLLENQPHVMYGWHAPGPTERFPDWEEDELLYLGISNDGKRRAMQHVDGKEWASEPGVRMMIEEKFDTRSASLAAEEAAIKSRRPRYNVVHNS